MFDPDFIDETEPLDSPERALWRGVLRQMLNDAQHYHSGLKVRQPYGDNGLEAHQQVIECGEQLQYVCTLLDLEPDYVSLVFRRWAKTNQLKKRVTPKRKRKKSTIT